MDILEIRSQRLSTLQADFMICQSCGFVDRDDERITVGYKCAHCGSPGSGARVYFLNPVRSMIDLMQEFYHPGQSASAKAEAPAEQNESNHQLAVIIFFCTLGEVLLQHFLKKRMSKMGIPHEIQDRLLNDNLFVKQRIQKLFPTLTGVKWKKAVTTLSDRVELDYNEATKFYQHASDARNKFLHEGNKFAIPQNMPEQCLRHIWPVVCLFVDMHNEYIAQ